MARRLGVLAAISAGWWTASGIAGAARHRRAAAASGEPSRWRDALRSELGSALLWIPSTVLSLWLTERYPLGRPTPRAMALHAGALGAAIAGRAAAVVAGNRIGRWYGTVPPARELLATSALKNTFEYAMITGAAHAIHYARAHRVREIQLARARLRALRAQVEPHFLFNALNAIAAVVHEDPARAEQMITQLGVLLRRSLDSDGAVEITLRDEVRVVRAYLDIEQVRFDDRLAVTWRVDPAALSAAVPPLVLQPLVENAVRHGVSGRAGAGRLEIAAWRQGRSLHVRISDDGAGISHGNGRTGVGLTNVRARLEALYGPEHRLAIRRPDGGSGTVVEIRLPFREPGTAAR